MKRRKSRFLPAIRPRTIPDMNTISKGLMITAAAGIGAGVAAGVAGGLVINAALSRRKPSLTGKAVLITGGSRGLGLALARAFAREGSRIAICARSAAGLDAARRDLQSRGAEVFTVECDVSDRSQVQRMVQAVKAHYGAIDILVNNAGAIQVGPLESMTIEDFERAMKIMFWGVVYPTLAALPDMIARGSGRIVNITSIGGKVAVPHLLPYVCAKFAATGFSEGLRAELADHGIKVITISPGLMRTGSHLNAEFKGNHDREAAWFSLSASLPLGSMSAGRAARQIVEATRRGRAAKILTVPANLLAAFHGVFPGLTSDILGAVDHFLLPSGNDTTSKRGDDTRAMHSPLLSAATVLGRNAARRFLQHPAAV
jgi:NAD(P)-dependent dehydrogenase (short-subunit alcohol dehydrogenase family)